MLERLALCAALLIATGCATRHVTTLNLGPEIDADIRAALTEGEMSSLVVIDGEQAFWIGGRALPVETAALTEAILSAPTSKGLRDYINAPPSAHVPGVMHFDPETVLAFRQPASVVEFSLRVDDGVRFVRVIRLPTGAAPLYDIFMRDAWDSDRTLAQRLDPSPALDAAWKRLVRRAGHASSQPHSSSPFFLGRPRREPLSRGIFRDVGVTNFQR